MRTSGRGGGSENSDTGGGCKNRAKICGRPSWMAPNTYYIDLLKTDQLIDLIKLIKVIQLKEQLNSNRERGIISLFGHYCEL